MSALIYILFAYLLGSIPFGFIIAKAVKNIDIREHGSGNIGATNVFRTVGKGWGIIVFLLDALKGFIAVAVPVSLWGVSGSFSLMLAISAILGHTFTFWLKFKGGKGIATSLGVFLGVAWVPTLCAFGVFLIFFLSTRILSVGSLVAAFSFPVFIVLFMRGQAVFPYLLGVSFLLCLFILYTHRENISRLRSGEEKKLF